MIYFVRRSFEADKNKLDHKKKLKQSVEVLLKKALAEYNVDYCEAELSYNSYGKPYLRNHSDVHFNISHCHELAVCAIGNDELGIDAENIREYSPRVVKRVFSEREKKILENAENKEEMFFRIWTLKESFVKALGIGISYPMKSCEFLIDDNGFTASGCDGYLFSQIILNNKFICSLCYKKLAVQENKLYRISNQDEVFCFEL